jgi:hypothetical protein
LRANGAQACQPSEEEEGLSGGWWAGERATPWVLIANNVAALKEAAATAETGFKLSHYQTFRSIHSHPP